MKKSSKNKPRSSISFGTGLSGGGIFISKSVKVHALQPGDSVKRAWTDTGERLAGSYAKLRHEPKKAG